MLNGKVLSLVSKREMPLKKANVEGIKEHAEALRQKALEELRNVIVNFQEGSISSKDLISALKKAGVDYTIKNDGPDENECSKDASILTFELDGKSYTFNLQNKKFKGHDDNLNNNKIDAAKNEKIGKQDVDETKNNN